MASHAFAKDNGINNNVKELCINMYTLIYIDVILYIYHIYLIINGKIYIYIYIWEDHLNDVCSSVCHAGLPENYLIIRSIQNWDGPNIGNHFALT